MENYTEIVVVLDRSGSMDAIRQDTIGGFNSFLADQQKEKGKCILTLVQFDDKYEVAVEPSDIAKVPKLDSQTYVPRGTTALLDAIGRTINSTGERFEKIPAKERPNKVIFVVITDGHENASSEFTHTKVMEKIKHQTDKYSWEFVYLGANQDAIAVGRDYGFRADRSMSFGTNKKGVNSSFASLSRASSRSRSGANMEFADSDRAEAMGEDDDAAILNEIRGITKEKDKKKAKGKKNPKKTKKVH